MTAKIANTLSSFIKIIAKSSVQSFEYLKESLASDHSDLLPLD